MASANPTFEKLMAKGDLIESTSEMTPEYLRELKHTLLVSGDTELISAPATTWRPSARPASTPS